MKGLFILLITGPHSPKGDGDGASGAMARMYNRTGKFRIIQCGRWFGQTVPLLLAVDNHVTGLPLQLLPDCPEGGQWRSSTRGAGQSSQNFDPSNLARSRHWRPQVQ